jgi:cytochrome P450
MAVEFSLESEDFQQRPDQYFEELRSGCPVAHGEFPAPFYAVSRHADVAAVLRDSDIWKSKNGPGLAYHGGGVLVSVDPPKHTTDRLAITKIFKPSAIEEMRGDMVALVDDVVGRFASTPGSSGDVIAGIGMPIPLTVMCWLLGTPVEDIEMFRQWVLPMAEAVSAVDGRMGERPAAAYKAFGEYFGAHVGARATAVKSGQDVPDDLLTRLLTVERDGQRLSRQDVMGFCQFLLVAGSATTTLLIGNVVARLVDDPELFERVRADESLIEAAVEESLRIDAPVHGLFRTNDEPVCMHGVDIPENSKVLALFGSANLDPEVWDNPHEFRLDRDMVQLRKHFAFGVGIHYCLGAPLARMEAQLAVQEILRRLPNLRSNGERDLVRASVLKGFETLPVAWG